MPQPRSITRRTPAAASRDARQAATSGRDACSRPSVVNQSRAASAPNLAWARPRSATWWRAAAASSGPKWARIAAAALSESGSAQALAADIAAEPSSLSNGCESGRALTVIAILQNSLAVGRRRTG